jgi:hypothetical protein
VQTLRTIPGVGELSAPVVLAEIGTDMSRFPTAGHLLAWAGLCLSQNESAGKRKRSRLRKGDCWLKTTMVQCAVNAAKNKDSYYKAQFSRLCAKHGAKKAFCAVAASMLTAIYHILKDGVEHKDLGARWGNGPAGAPPVEAGWSSLRMMVSSATASGVEPAPSIIEERP